MKKSKFFRKKKVLITMALMTTLTLVFCTRLLYIINNMVGLSLLLVFSVYLLIKIKPSYYKVKFYNKNKIFKFYKIFFALCIIYEVMMMILLLTNSANINMIGLVLLGVIGLCYSNILNTYLKSIQKSPVFNLVFNSIMNKGELCW